MIVLNDLDLDRDRLALGAIKHIPRLHDRVPAETARYWTTMECHKLYIAENGNDMPEVHARAARQGSVPR